MTLLEMKDKLLSAIALVDQVADEIGGERAEKLKRLSSELFEIEYDI